MKHVIPKLVLWINSILLIAYMGLTVNTDIYSSSKGIVPLFLSSLLLIDTVYISSCNVKGSKSISSFCILLALHSWYILLSVSNNTGIVFYAQSPIIWYVSIKFILIFLFQDGGYKFQKLVNICLTVSCACPLIGILVSDRIFALLYGIQFLTNWLCFFFIVIYHRKRVVFVFKSEWKHILFSLVTSIVLALIYYFSTIRVPEHLSNFGIYLPVLLFTMSIHCILLKNHNSLPLSTVFSKYQMFIVIVSGVITCGIVTISLGTGYYLFFLMLNTLSAFMYACNVALDVNLRKGETAIIKESKYHNTLLQLQQEEQLNLEFANFLHDDILQDLLSIRNMMSKAGQPDIQNIITDTLDSMNTCIREQMQNYHPILLPNLTIKENYQNLIQNISESFPNRNICVIFDCSDSVFLVEPYNIFVFRLIKELVTNIYKHSTGEKAWITLTQNSGVIILCVSDNGNTDANTLETTNSSMHRGLTTLSERVNNMGGTISISNNIPHGICTQITLPMKGDVSYQYFISR